jgi:hypothetical protein
MVHTLTCSWFCLRGPACLSPHLSKLSKSKVHQHTPLPHAFRCSPLPSPPLCTWNQLAESTFPPTWAVLWILSSLPEISSSSLQQMKFLVTPLQVTDIATSWCIHPNLNILFFFFPLLHVLQLVTLDSWKKKKKDHMPLEYNWSL